MWRNTMRAVAGSAVLADRGDQAGHALAGVHGIEEQALEARAQVERLATAARSGRRSRRRCGRGRSRSVPSGAGRPASAAAAAASRGTDVVEVGSSADVDAEHRGVVAPTRHQAGVGAAGAVGRRDEGGVGELVAELQGGSHVARADRSWRPRPAASRTAGGRRRAAGRRSPRWPPRARSTRAVPPRRSPGRGAGRARRCPWRRRRGRSRARSCSRARGGWRPRPSCARGSTAGRRP